MNEKHVRNRDIKKKKEWFAIGSTRFAYPDKY